MPVIRYRTGDRVRKAPTPCACGRTFLRLEGGVIGRVDDVLIVRGVNVFPSAIENIVRLCPEAGEFAVDIYRRGAMDEIDIRIETQAAEPERVANTVRAEIRNALGLRVNVIPVEYGTLPRFDLKARRFTDHRTEVPQA